MAASGWVHLVGCTVKRLTDKAVLLEVPNGNDWREVWVPRSQVSEAGDNLSEGDIDVTVSVKEWFASKEGLEGE